MISNNYYFTYTNYLIVNETDVELGNFHSPSKVNYDQMLRNDPVGCLTVIYNSNKLGKHMMPSIRKRQDWGFMVEIIEKKHLLHMV